MRPLARAPAEGDAVRSDRPSVDLSRVVVVRAAERHRGTTDARLPLPPEVLVVPVGRAMVDALVASDAGVVVIDHEPGEFDLLRVCRDVRESVNPRVLVVGSIAASAEEVVIGLLDAGADEVLSRDTSAAMFQARLRVALRTAPVSSRRSRQILLGDVVIDLDAHAVVIAGEDVKCPPRQFVLLLALARQADRVVPRGVLLSTVWGAEPESVDTRRLRIAISLLRSLLGTGAERPQIETVSHVGYRLALPSPV